MVKRDFNGRVLGPTGPSELCKGCNGTGWATYTQYGGTPCVLGGCPRTAFGGHVVREVVHSVPSAYMLRKEGL